MEGMMDSVISSVHQVNDKVVHPRNGYEGP